MTRRATGCRKGKHPDHEIRTPFRLHPAMKGAARSSTPTSVDLRAQGFTPPTKNQGQTGSCEGHRASTCIQTTAAAAGTPLPWTPSEADIYRAGRELERARATAAGDELPVLEDNGTTTEAVVAAISAFGIRARSRPTTSDGRNSDAEPATINDDQELDELEADALAIVAGEYAIDPAASDAVLQIRVALSASPPIAVGFDFFVDTAFEDWGDNWSPALPAIGAPNENDPTGGGHAITCCGYRTAADGSTEFMLLNSWGEEVGDVGVFWASEAWARRAWGISVWNVRVALAAALKEAA